MAEYKIQLPVFEGPLDLLLYLIKDIYEVNLTRIATQFIEYLEEMKKADLDVAGEFMVMAATLVWIKSKELLPVDRRSLEDLEEESTVDPRWELIQRLVEYKKFKEVSGELQRWEVEQEDVFPHQIGKQNFPIQEELKLNVSLMDLLRALNSVLGRMEERGMPKEIEGERWTVREKITFLKDTLRKYGRMMFSDLFKSAATRLEVVVTFLALLELARLHEVQLEQAETFGEINILDVSATSNNHC
jgi:segregation and condensation protein A